VRIQLARLGAGEPEPSRQVRVELDGEHAAGGAGQLGRQPAAAGAKIEHQVAGTNTGLADGLRGERLRAEEAGYARCPPGAFVVRAARTRTITVIVVGSDA